MKFNSFKATWPRNERGTFNQCPFTFQYLTVQSHFCFVDRTVGAPTNHTTPAEQIFGSNFPLTDMFLQRGSIHISDESWRFFPLTFWGFLPSVPPSVPGLVILGRRLSGLASADPLLARRKTQSMRFCSRKNEGKSDHRWTRERERARRSISIKQRRQRWRRSASKLYR